MKKIVLNLLFVFIIFHLSEGCTQSVEPEKLSQMNHYKKFGSDYVDSRQVDVWLPPGYENQDKSYPVIYMHDGQNLFYDSLSYIGVSWNVDETMSELIHNKKIRKAIIVGVWNTSKRFEEYMPAEPVRDLNKKLSNNLNRRISKLESDAYLKFLVHELKPFIDSTYRTRTDPENTYIMGSSMGGLISWYALANYPEVFGGAGCLSTHWPVKKEDAGDILFNELKMYFKRKMPAGGTHKIYFDYGTETLDSLYEPYQKQIDAVMQEIGYTEGADWKTMKFKGHEHSERAWRERLHYPLKFLLAPEN